MQRVIIAVLIVLVTTLLCSLPAVTAPPPGSATAPPSTALPGITDDSYPTEPDDSSLIGPGWRHLYDEPDLNRQDEKYAFLSQAPKGEIYLGHTREWPLNPAYELKAGWNIPCILIGGINSDLPGQILAQVRQNVYDSVTGTNLLIPAGSRIIGTYDSRIATGQTRALPGMTRLIYPDGSWLLLDFMPASDESGYAGFHDQVNNHHLRIFGSAILLSLFSAGIQLSQPQDNNTTGYTTQQILAAEVGRQTGQLGTEIARRNLQIQPTLRIRPGYRFNITLPVDVILPPWSS